MEEKLTAIKLMEDNEEYYAFISYKREDEKWAKWLQHKLEHYKLPSNLNGRADLPRNIRPVFRDVSDLTPGLLGEEIDKALHNSQWLIVICSPRSAKSPWVCKEAQTFVNLGRADHIIPFIIEGNPFSDDIETECYPDALLNLTGSKELLAANINEMGRDAAAIKVVARMFGLKFDTLWQRFERERRKKIWIWRVSIGSVVLFVFFVAVWIFSLNRKILKNQVRLIAEKVDYNVKNGNATLAQLVSIEVLSSKGLFGYPYMPELEASFREAALHTSSSLVGHNDLIQYACFSNNDSLVATSSWDKTIKIWNASNGSCLSTYNDNANGYSVCFSPDDRYVAFPTDGSLIKVYNLEVSQCEMKIADTSGTVLCVCYSNDGSKMISTTGRINMWDSETGRCLKSFLGHTGIINCAIFSKDDRYIVSASQDSTIKLWDVETGQCIRTFRGHEGSVNSICWGHSDNILISASDDRKVIVWDVPSGQIIRTIDAGKTYSLNGSSERYVKSVDFCRNAGYIISSCGNKIRFWKYWGKCNPACAIEKEEGLCLKTIECPSGEINNVKFSHNGRYLVASTQGNTAQIIELETNFEYPTTEFGGKSHYPYQASYDSKGEKVCAYNRDSVFIWDAEHHGLLFRYPGHYICFSPDSKYFAIATNDNNVEIWDNYNSIIPVKTIKGSFDRIHSISFNNDFSIIVTSGINKITIWDMNHNIRQFTRGLDYGSRPGIKNIDNIRCAHFSPDGTTFFAAYEKKVILFDTKTKKMIKRIDVDAYDACYNHDGTKIAIASEKKGLCIWDLRRHSIKTFDDHRWEVCSVCFSPDGQYIASVSMKGSIKIFDVESKTCMYTWSRNSATSVSFSVDGKKILSAVSQSRNPLVIRDYPSLQEVIEQTKARLGKRQLTQKERMAFNLE